MFCTTGVIRGKEVWSKNHRVLLSNRLIRFLSIRKGCDRIQQYFVIHISKKQHPFLQSCDNSPSLLYIRNRSHTFHSFLWNRQIKLGVFIVSWRIQALIFKVQLVIHGKLININFKTMVWNTLIVLPLAAFSSILPLSHTSWNTPRSSLWQNLFVSCVSVFFLGYLCS